MTLEVVVKTASPDGPVVHRSLALNEVVVERSSAGHTVRIAAKIGEESFLTYAADGILVATPTGSTAYNLSLRGPVVSPRLRAIILTPIAPHMLFDRTLVIEPNEAVRLELLPDRPAVAVIDGLSIIELMPGDIVEVHEGPHPARVITIGPGGLYKILRAKFGLTDR
jgi:NAD+ kinase